MEPLDLEQIIEEIEFGLHTDLDQTPEAEQEHFLDMPDPHSATREIERAIDELCQEHLPGDYNLPVESQYLFDPHYHDSAVECIFFIFGG